MYLVETIFVTFKYFDEIMRRFMRPRAKTFLKDILIMIPLLYLMIYAKFKLIFICNKDFVVVKCDTPL